MDSVHTMGKNAPKLKKTRIVSVVVEFENGFPTEHTIRSLMRGFGMDDNKISFSDDYGLKSKSGILWQPQREIDDAINGFIKFIKFNGIDVETIKLHGLVHSLYFQQKMH